RRRRDRRGLRRDPARAVVAGRDHRLQVPGPRGAGPGGHRLDLRAGAGVSRLAALALAALGVCGFAPAPDLVVALARGRVDASGEGWAAAPVRGQGAAAAAGPPLLTLPVVIANTDTVATTLTGLTATDAEGPVPLAAHDDPVALAYSRHWTAARA